MKLFFSVMFQNTPETLRLEIYDEDFQVKIDHINDLNFDLSNESSLSLDSTKKE